jgi:exopolysaccharide biosynthesis protein
MAGKTKLPKSKPLRTLLFCVVIIVVVCVAAIGYNAYQTVKTVKAPEDAATAFLNDIETNSVADAYNQLCSSTKSDFTQAEFAAYVKKQPGIKNHSTVSGKLRKVNGVTSAIIVEDILHSGGTDEKHSIVLQHSGDRWLVCGQPY